MVSQRRDLVHLRRRLQQVERGVEREQRLAKRGEGISQCERQRVEREPGHCVVDGNAGGGLDPFLDRRQ